MLFDYPPRSALLRRGPVGAWRPGRGLGPGVSSAAAGYERWESTESRGTPSPGERRDETGVQTGCFRVVLGHTRARLAHTEPMFIAVRALGKRCPVWPDRAPLLGSEMPMGAYLLEVTLQRLESLRVEGIPEIFLLVVRHGCGVAAPRESTTLTRGLN